MAEAHPDMTDKPTPMDGEGGLQVQTKGLENEGTDPLLDNTLGTAMGLSINRQRTVMEAPTPGMQASKEDIKPIFEDLFKS